MRQMRQLVADKGRDRVTHVAVFVGEGGPLKYIIPGEAVQYSQFAQRA